MHLERSITVEPHAVDPHTVDPHIVHGFSLNNEARVRVLYNASKRQVSAGPDPKLVARPILVSFLHTSNEKHHFFNFV